MLPRGESPQFQNRVNMKPRIIIPPSRNKKTAAKHSYNSLPRIIYVIELDPAVANFPQFAKQNLGFVAGLFLYVGSTTLTAEERFNNHLAGVLASEVVRRFGRALRMDLAPPQKPIQRKLALVKEKIRAKQLRSQGFAVYQN